MAIRKITALECVCDSCAHRWIAETLPKRCAKCKARHWNSGGPRKRITVH